MGLGNEVDNDIFEGNAVLEYGGFLGHFRKKGAFFALHKRKHKEWRQDHKFSFEAKLIYSFD